jgi:ubiquinone/menaquinone biosynthesis C-methylase UbiE
MMSTTDGDYVLGTKDDEIARLGLQHLVWRARACGAWRRAGFTVGQHLADVGCGPGYATLDLAAIVGPSGHVTAIDRSPRFLDVLGARATRQQLDNVSRIAVDLDQAPLPALDADGAWCRWVFAFVSRAHRLLVGLRDMLRPGGVLVLHEYFDYSTWRISPSVEDFEAFVQTVMRSWRDTGGEPDIALDLLRWLPELGFRVLDVRPLVDVVSPQDFVWQWPAAFVETGLQRLVDLGYFHPDRAERVRQSFAAAAAAPNVRMVTPAVLEIIAATSER